MAASRAEALLVPSHRDAEIPADHFVRGFRALVEEVLGERLRSVCAMAGGYDYDPVGLFCAWQYAAMKGESSCRGLEESCRFDIRFRFLTGGAFPDHSTLARFRRALDADGGLDGLMLLLAKEAGKLGLTDSKVWIVDGTKIAGAVTQWRARKSAQGPEAAVSVAEDREAEAKAEPEGPAAEPEKKETSDPEARTLKTTHGEYVSGFNLQAAVFPSGYVAAGAVEDAANDAGALEGLLAAGERQTGSSPEVAVGDKGYHTPRNLETLDALGIEGYLVPKDRKAAPFAPDEEGTLRCLAGHAATTISSLKRGVLYDVHRVSRCKGCPLMEDCGGKGRQREMAVQALAGDDSHYQARLRAENAARCRSEEGAALLKTRGPTVERLFAIMKRDFRKRRLNLRGRAGARLEFLLICIACNLRTILKARTAASDLLIRLLSELIAAICVWIASRNQNHRLVANS